MPARNRRAGIQIPLGRYIRYLETSVALAV
jgi:hypothetical protein